MSGPHPPKAEDTFSDEAERKARLLFWGSLLLSMLIILHLVLSVRGSAHLSPVLSMFLVAMLLWSLLMSAHAFHLLTGIIKHRQSQSGRFTDAHTGVFTLEYLNSCLEQEHKRARESGIGATVAYLDLENLERVNHNFGYTVGDIALKAIADLVSGCLRPGDVLGRIGGDQFLIVMPETDMDDAAAVAGKVEQAVEEYCLDLGKRGRIDYLRCNTGIAAFPADGETPEDIIAAAHANVGQPEPA
ncbi:MAG: GGDEF domain-containing protein [Candidatus Brocadiaceae bacterium]|jgi:diguanylate cyclase (GGDEF)-like protein